MHRILIFFLVIILYSCSDTTLTEISDDCVWSDDIKRTFDRDDERPCVYTDVYSLNDKLFTICNCCQCNKIEQVLSCDGTNICTSISDCTSSFLDEAVYLYSFE